MSIPEAPDFSSVELNYEQRAILRGLNPEIWHDDTAWDESFPLYKSLIELAQDNMGKFAVEEDSRGWAQAAYRAKSEILSGDVPIGCLVIELDAVGEVPIVSLDLRGEDGILQASARHFMRRPRFSKIGINGLREEFPPTTKLNTRWPKAWLVKRKIPGWELSLPQS